MLSVMMCLILKLLYPLYCYHVVYLPMKMFTVPDDCKHPKNDEVIKQFEDEALEAAKPAPPPCNAEAVSVSSVFVAHKTLY
mmetsp:Transcript_5908/g.10671  ORF Transcript_5908/g.10671 Transcript_5908/m.10671 type:complete len:81 (+) Transcript_5908:681-923(+)